MKKNRVKNFFADFKKFISRGNILDMAVGVIVGSAFSAIVTAFTNKIIMPLINWVLMAITGGHGMEGAYTFLKWVPNPDTGAVDLANSIYIDWGAFITAILNFLIIAMTLFIILKVAMNARGYLDKEKKAKPTKAEKQILKAEGVNMKDRKAVLAATAELRERNKPAPIAPAPTQEQLLAGILAELKAQNAKAEAPAEVAAVVVEEKPAEKPAKKAQAKAAKTTKTAKSAEKKPAKKAETKPAKKTAKKTAKKASK